MSNLKWFQRLSLNQKDIYYRMILAFGLFFISPLAGFAYFLHKYDLFQDQYTLYFLLGFFCLSLIGFFILRRLFDQIHSVSRDVAQKVVTGFHVDQLTTGANELHNIV